MVKDNDKSKSGVWISDVTSSRVFRKWCRGGRVVVLTLALCVCYMIFTGSIDTPWFLHSTKSSGSIDHMGVAADVAFGADDVEVYRKPEVNKPVVQRDTENREDAKVLNKKEPNVNADVEKEIPFVKPTPRTKKEVKDWPHPALEVVAAHRVEKGDQTMRDLVVGIPTIRRAKHNYLLKTLESLLGTLENDESGSLLIVVMVGDLDRTKAQITIEEVQGRFGAFLDTGVLEIIQAPPESYFPDLHDLKDRFGDSKERTYWRSKQCLDFALLMEYSRTRGTYYLQLEDDVITTEGWFKYIMYYVTTRRREFFMIHFSRLGFIGKLFPSTVLKGLVQLFTLYFDEAPVDILLPAYGKRQKEETLKTTNTIFQHIGLDSSLEGKTQPLQDHGFTTAKKALQNAQLEVEHRQMSGKGDTDSLAARMEEMKERRENRKRLPVPGVPAGG